MTRELIALAGALTLGLAASAANAAPIGAAVADRTAVDGAITLVHGLHKACSWDSYGYHRSRPWGRINCPVTRRFSPAYPLALWMWRCADGHCGYWHRKEHRWREGFNHKGNHRRRYN